MQDKKNKIEHDEDNEHLLQHALNQPYLRELLGT